MQKINKAVDRAHADEVLLSLRRYGRQQCVELVDQLGLKHPTVYALLKRLEDGGYLSRFYPSTRYDTNRVRMVRRRRSKRVYWQLTEDGKNFAKGIDKP